MNICVRDLFSFLCARKCRIHTRIKITSLTEHCGSPSSYTQRIMMHGASIHKDNGLSVVHVTVKQGLLITCMPT